MSIELEGEPLWGDALCRLGVSSTAAPAAAAGTAAGVEAAGTGRCRVPPLASLLLLLLPGRGAGLLIVAPCGYSQGPCCCLGHAE
jgi:hypothetical protein